MRPPSPLRPAFADAGAAFAVADGVERATRVAGLEVEYRAVREHVGVGDLSDLGRIRVAGEAARDALDGLLAGNVQNLPENAMRGTVALGEDGRILAQTTVHCLFDEYLLTTDGDSRGALLGLLEAGMPAGVRVADLSDSHGMLRVDGPDAADLPRALFGLEAAGLRLMSLATCRLDGAEVIVSRIGSTGEYGYTLMAERDALPEILERLRRLVPDAALCGSDAYDVLLLEMRSFNRRRDLPHDEPLLAAGLHWMIDFRKPAFVGRDAVLAAKKRGLQRRMVCVRLDRGAPVPAPDAVVRLERRAVGYVAHAAFSLALAAPIGLAYLDASCAVVGLPVTVDTRGGPAAARTVSAPFVRTRSNAGRSG
ncbi:MAG: aminomethyltransferase family protein [Candidatus Rokuibacteriota bacterium]